MAKLRDENLIDVAKMKAANMLVRQQQGLCPHCGAEKNCKHHPGPPPQYKKSVFLRFVVTPLKFLLLSIVILIVLPFYCLYLLVEKIIALLRRYRYKKKTNPQTTPSGAVVKEPREELQELLMPLQGSEILGGLLEKAQNLLNNGTKIGETVIYTIRTETQGEWVYFSNYNDYMSLYKIKIDGTGLQKLNNEKSYDIEVRDDWIFYRNSTDGRFYRMRTDGTERQLRR